MSRAWWAAPADSRRSSGRTWTVRGVTTATVALLMVAGAGAVGATSPHVAERATTTTGYTIRPSVRALAVGCGSAEYVTDPTSKVGWVDYDGELRLLPDDPRRGLVRRRAS